MNASAQDTELLRIGPIDAVLTTPAGVDRPPVALLIAGSGPTDHDGNGPGMRPATLRKLAEQLALRNIASLRYDKRGAGEWKAEYGKPEDFRFKDFAADAVALAEYLRNSGKFSDITLIGHSEGGLVAILAAQQTPVDRLVLLATTARRQGELIKAQLKGKVPSDMLEAIGKAIDCMMAGQIVDPLPPGLSIPPPMQPVFASAFVEDPIPPLKQIAQPILIVGGGRDLQVAKIDFDDLAAAAPAAKTLWIPNMNHVLNDVGDDADNLAAYNEPERPLDAALLNAIAAFVRQR